MKAADSSDSYPKKFTYAREEGDKIELYDGSRGEWGTQFKKVDGKHKGEDKSATNYFESKLIAGAFAESDIDTEKNAGWLGFLLVLKEPVVKNDPKDTANLV